VNLAGAGSLWLALVAAIVSAAAFGAGAVLRRDRLALGGAWAACTAFVCLAFASIAFVRALLVSDFSLRYVATHTTLNLPAYYKYAAFWAGHAGTALFWCLALSLWTALAAVTGRREYRALTAWTSCVLATMLTLFILVALFATYPFAALPMAPQEGRGLGPWLQHVSLALYPPSVYLGALASAVPFALTVAALATRRVGASWAAAVARWTSLSLVLLTVGAVLGMWRAYADPVTRDLWARTPVASGAVLAWLTATVLLHTIATHRQWRAQATVNVTLSIVTFVFSVRAALLVRNELVERVNALTVDTGSQWIVACVAVAAAAAVFLAWIRRVHLGEALISAVPAVSPRYARIGGYVVHVGAAVLALAIAGHAFRQDHDFAVGPGSPHTLRDPFGREWVFSGQGVSTNQAFNREMLIAALRPERSGKPQPIVRSEASRYFDSFGRDIGDVVTRPGVLGSMLQDVYVVAADATPDGQAHIHLTFIPLMRLAWIGGCLMIFGGVVALGLRAPPPSEAEESAARAEELVSRARTGVSSAGA